MSEYKVALFFEAPREGGDIMPDPYEALVGQIAGAGQGLRAVVSSTTLALARELLDRLGRETAKAQLSEEAAKQARALLEALATL